MNWEVCNQHYRRDLYQQFARSFTLEDARSGSSASFQHSMSVKQGKNSRKLRDDFGLAVTAKISGQFDNALERFTKLLRKADLTDSLRAECHYQSGEILQYMQPKSISWVKHMVACHTFYENHFRALHEVSRFVSESEDEYVENEGVPRIILVLGSNQATVTFANLFTQKCPIIGLIQQYAQYPVLSSRYAPENGELPFGLSSKENAKFTDNSTLGNQWNALFLDNTRIPSIYIHRGEANSPHVLEWLDSLKPDLIVSHGPERLKPEFINLAKHGGINVHWGLSPMYRGMDTSRWALLHKEAEWVGVTIHKLDANLDTGPIIYQARPKIESGDTFRMVEYRLTMLACEIVPKAVEEVCSGKARLVHQDLSKGTQYWASQWSDKYEEILTPEYITGEIEKYYAEKDIRDKQAPLINPWHS